MHYKFKFSAPVHELSASDLFKEFEALSKLSVSKTLDWFDRKDNPQPYQDSLSSTELMYYGFLWNTSYTALGILKPMLRDNSPEEASELAKNDKKLQAVILLLQ